MTDFEKRYIYVCEKLKKYCVPYETNLKKIRIGDERDGGYVVSELPGYDALYSYGCDDKTSFERAFYDLYKRTHTYMIILLKVLQINQTIFIFSNRVLIRQKVKQWTL